MFGITTGLLTNQTSKQAFKNYLTRQDYPPNMRAIIEKFASFRIEKIEIVRTPLASWTNMLLNIFSLGDFNRIKKQNKYDDYFHLNLNIVLERGNNVMVEKNQVLNMERKHKKTEKSEVMNVPNIPSNLTLFEFIEGCRKIQGKNFFIYNASNNNCQKFARDCLLGSNINTPDTNNFIIQDTESLFKNQFLRKATNSVLDVATTIDPLIQGYGIDIDGKTNNLELMEILQELHINLVGIFMKDTLPDKLKAGIYIVNLNSEGEKGSHWVCFKVIGKNVYYFDSFGGYPVQSVMDKAAQNKMKVLYSTKQYQHIDSELCGWFCVAFLHLTNKVKNKDMTNKLDVFDKMFKTNTKLNDKILTKYIESFYS